MLFTTTAPRKLLKFARNIEIKTTSPLTGRCVFTNNSYKLTDLILLRISIKRNRYDLVKIYIRQSAPMGEIME